MKFRLKQIQTKFYHEWFHLCYHYSVENQFTWNWTLSYKHHCIRRYRVITHQWRIAVHVKNIKSKAKYASPNHVGWIVQAEYYLVSWNEMTKTAWFADQRIILFEICHHPNHRLTLLIVWLIIYRSIMKRRQIILGLVIWQRAFTP